MSLVQPTNPTHYYVPVLASTLDERPAGRLHRPWTCSYDERARRLGQHVRVGQHVWSGQLVWRSLVRNADQSAVCSRNFESRAAGMENETCSKHVFTNCARRLSEITPSRFRLEVRHSCVHWIGGCDTSVCIRRLFRPDCEAQAHQGREGVRRLGVQSLQ